MSKDLVRKLRMMFLTWFGCGYVPKAPGTMGSLGTMPLAWWLVSETSPTIRVICAVFMTLFACWLAGADQKDNAIRDPQYIVIDETAGILWSTAWLPSAGFQELAAAFFIFRFLDVLKPFPANFFDRSSKTAKTAIARGSHIIFDDVVAGLYTAGIMSYLVFVLQ